MWLLPSSCQCFFQIKSITAASNNSNNTQTATETRAASPIEAACTICGIDAATSGKEYVTLKSGA